MRQTATLGLLAGIMVFALVVGGTLFGGARSSVLWRSLRAVTIESDDWGLAGFVPDADAWKDLDRQDLHTGTFPEVYWLSTLEDSSMVAALNGVLAGHVGRDGHSAVMQPNYVMSSLAYASDQWSRYDLPSLPPAYQRPGLWSAVRQGMALGTWYPEFHATWHYDPDLRKDQARKDGFASQVTDRGIMLFSGSERAWELGAWRPRQILEQELDHSLAVFRSLFGREVNAVMAPDYHWDDRMEDLWESRNLIVIQGKREQINPAWGGGKWGRVRKFLARQWSRLRYPGRIYLERNCRLEPAQAPEPEAVMQACVAATRDAWEDGQPAIVESHRVNFAHTDPQVVSLGLDILDRYLSEISDDPAEAPLFLTDHELAQLYVRGTSWRVRGGVLVVNNGTLSRKVVPIPAEAWNQAAAQSGGTPVSQAVLVAVPPASTIDHVP